jgi:hypothetical protein
MNKWQKIALFNISVIAACFIACFVLAAAMQIKQVVTPPTPLALVIIPSLVIVAISKILFRKKAGRVDYDERDIQIQRKSQIVGLWSFVISIVILNVVCVLAIGPHRALKYPLVLLLMICAAGGIWIITESIATLVIYNLTGQGDKS